MITCKKCGRANQDHYRFCLGCGARLADQRAAKPEPEPEPAPKPAPEPVALGAKASAPEPKPAPAPAPAAPPPVPEPKAAEPAPKPEPKPEPAPKAADPAPQAAASGERICTGCGSPVPPDFMFCGKCGTRYVEPEPAAAAEPEPEVIEVDVSPPEPDPVAFLVVIRPDGSEGERLSLFEGTRVIGQDSGPPFGGDPFLAPEHATFIIEDGQITLHDHDTVNGVYVRVLDALELTHDTMIRVGQELLHYQSLTDLDPLIEPSDDTRVLGASEPRAWGRLERVVAPGLSSHAWLLDKAEVDLGRDVGDIVFPDDGFVSGLHARLSQSGGKAYLRDLDSSNGTYVRMRAPHSVSHGDLILLGQQVVRIDLA